MKRFFKYPLLIIIAGLGLTVFFALQLKDVVVDNGIRMFFPQKHESYRRLIETEKKYGGTEMIGIVLETEQGDFIIDENIRVVQSLTSQLEECEGIDRVQSLSNIDYLYGKDGGLAADCLIPPEYAGTQSDIIDIKEKLSNWDDMYDRLIISDDLCSSQIMITLDAGLSNAQKVAILNTVRALTSNAIEKTNLTATYVGDPVISETSGILIGKDLITLIPLVVLVVLICLFLSFKTLDGTILPLITVLMSTCWSLGLIAILKVNFTIVSTVIPVALIAVGSAYGIHVLNHYYIALDAWKKKNPSVPMTKDIHKDIIIVGLKDVLLPVLLAGLTTIAGFLSLITSPLSPLQGFSAFVSAGIAFALILSVTFIPSLMMLKSVKKIGEKSKKIDTLKAEIKKKTQRKIAKTFAFAEDVAAESRPRRSKLYSMYAFFAGSKARLIVFCLVMIVCSAVGMKRVVVDTALINYFPPDGKLRQDVNYVDKRFAGTNSIYFIVGGEDKGSMTNPEILSSLDGLQNYLVAKYSEVGKVVSFTSFVKRMNQVMHIPQTTIDPSLAESVDSGLGELSSFDSDDLSSFGSDDFSFFDESETAATSNSPSTDFIDPNIAYATELASKLSVEDGLAMINRAYAAAGAKKATVKDIVNELYKELNYNGAAYYEIPYDVSKYPVASREELSNLVSQYLLLFSGSLDQFADDPLEPSEVRVVVQLRTRSTVKVNGIIRDATDYAAKHFPEGYTINATGGAELEYTMTDMIISSQLVSLLLSLVCVFIIISIAFKSPVAGCIGCVPLFFCILLNYMTMGFTQINLDMFTSLIASLAVGIGIDYTIHFMTNYREERLACDDLETVTRRTLKKSGRGIVTNALAVGFGFLVLCLSNLIVLRYIGVLVAVVMFTSSILAMTVIPGILNIFDPKFMRKDAHDKQ